MLLVGWLVVGDPQDLSLVTGAQRQLFTMGRQVLPSLENV